MSRTNSKALGSGLESRVVRRAIRSRLQARRQPGSGTFSGFPSDVLLSTRERRIPIRALMECKVRSTHPSMAEMLAWLDKVEREAKHCVDADFGVLCYNPKGSRHPKVLLDLDIFLDLLNAADQ